MSKKKESLGLPETILRVNNVPYTVKFYQNGNTITAYTSDYSWEYITKATCCETDKFDIRKGMNLALIRLEKEIRLQHIDEYKKKIKEYLLLANREVEKIERLNLQHGLNRGAREHPMGYKMKRFVLIKQDEP